MRLQRTRRDLCSKVRSLGGAIKGHIQTVLMRLPKTGKELYNRVQPPAEAIKGYIQIAIGIAVIIVFASRCVSHPPNVEFNIAREALSLVGYGLAASAAVELAYTFFTKGPDEALDPLILGVSSFTLIALSRIDPPRLKTSDTIPISLLALVILLLFLTRRFMLEMDTRLSHFRGVAEFGWAIQPESRAHAMAGLWWLPRTERGSRRGHGRQVSTSSRIAAVVWSGPRPSSRRRRRQVARSVTAVS
jgi:hypothetical protein